MRKHTLLFVALITLGTWSCNSDKSTSKNLSNTETKTEELKEEATPVAKPVKVVDSAAIVAFGESEFSQQFFLKKYKNFGQMWGKEQPDWVLPVNKKPAKELFGHVLPKSVIGGNELVCSYNEIAHFAKLNNIKVKKKGKAFYLPESWNNKFKEGIQTLVFNKPLYVMAVGENTHKLITVDSLVGKRFYSFMPHQESFAKELKDNIPVCYYINGDSTIAVGENDKGGICNFICLLSPKAVDAVKKQEVKVWSHSQFSGPETMQVTMRATHVDITGNKETDIIRFYENLDDQETDEGDESASYTGEFIYINNDSVWHCSATYQDGQDGVEGF